MKRKRSKSSTKNLAESINNEIQEKNSNNEGRTGGFKFQDANDVEKILKDVKYRVEE
jgi:hypothetical protein